MKKALLLLLTSFLIVGCQLDKKEKEKNVVQSIVTEALDTTVIEIDSNKTITPAIIKPENEKVESSDKEIEKTIESQPKITEPEIESEELNAVETIAVDKPIEET